MALGAKHGPQQLVSSTILLQGPERSLKFQIYLILFYVSGYAAFTYVYAHVCALLKEARIPWTGTYSYVASLKQQKQQQEEQQKFKVSALM